MVDKDGFISCDICEGIINRGKDVYIRGMNICLNCADTISRNAEIIKQENPKRKRIVCNEPRQLDKGKIKALYNAGWSIKNIASELVCSTNTLRKNMNQMIEDGELCPRK